MSRIFLSHSSANNAEAIAVRDWMQTKGWDDVFLDLDPERGLKAGDRWQAALKAAVDRCELVIFIVSPEWAASSWCKAEFLLTKHGSKPKAILPVVVSPTPFSDLPGEMTAEYQSVDLTAGERTVAFNVVLPPGDKTATVAFSEQGLQRLKIGIERNGIDAKHFTWPPADDPDRPPYRGLQPLEADDAGIFFGRDAQVIAALDELRGLRETAPPRLLVILGASGAGKSSFMRAGLWPRLVRDDRHFLPLPVIRPEHTVLSGETGLLRSLEGALQTAKLPVTRADLRAAIDGGVATLRPLLQALVDKVTPAAFEAATKPKPPTLILPIDQAEELFLAEGHEEAQPFLAMLRDLLASDEPNVIALFTIRSDNYERLQLAKPLEGLRQVTLSLPPMPKGAYAEVIKGPARRLEGTPREIKVDDALVQALLTDIEAGGAKDALPLLAFTLERLYGEYRAGGHLKLEHYNQLGGIAGSIEAAVEQAFKAADAEPRIPRDRQARLALLRRGLIPWIAGIDPDTGAPRRRVARLSEIPTEARPLMDLLVDQHLLSTDVAQDTNEKTVEPAHEALLRRWGLLQGWLDEDAGLLSVMGAVKRASRDWAANGKGAAWVTHSGDRLRAAERLLDRHDLAANLEPTDRDYLAASRTAERAARSRRRRVTALVGVLLIGLLGVGWLASAGLLDWTKLKVQGRRLADVYMPTVLTLEKERALTPGDDFQECASCPEMVVVPAGTFMMGSPEKEIVNDGGGRRIERTQRQVTIAEAFAVGKYEVTFDEWDACVAHGPCKYRWTAGLSGAMSWALDDNGWGRGRQPAIFVSWDHAKTYVDWLSRQTGKPYRLLSEAEWEYAARAVKDPTTPNTKYFWGDDPGKGKANGGFSFGCEWCSVKTAPVGQFRANDFRLHDMLGNVWELVEDCYVDYKDAPMDSTGKTPETCSSYVIRGGGYLSYNIELRSAYRSFAETTDRVDDIGFRIARTLSPPSP